MVIFPFLPIPMVMEMKHKVLYMLSSKHVSEPSLYLSGHI